MLYHSELHRTRTAELAREAEQYRLVKAAVAASDQDGARSAESIGAAVRRLATQLADRITGRVEFHGERPPAFPLPRRQDATTSVTIPSQRGPQTQATQTRRAVPGQGRLLSHRP